MVISQRWLTDKDTKAKSRRSARRAQPRWSRPALERLEDRTLLSADYTNAAAGLHYIFEGLQTAVNDHLWSPPGQLNYQYSLPLTGANLEPQVQFLHDIGVALGNLSIAKNADAATVAQQIHDAILPVVQGPQLTVNIVPTPQAGEDDFEIQIDNAVLTLNPVPFNLGLPGLDSADDKLTQFVNNVEKKLTDTVQLTYNLDVFVTVDTNAKVQLDTTPNFNRPVPLLDLTVFSVTLPQTTLTKQDLGGYSVDVTAQGSFQGPGTVFNVNLGTYAYQNNNLPIDVNAASTVAFQVGAVPSFELDVNMDQANYPSLDFNLAIKNWALFVGSNPFDYANKDVAGNQPTIFFGLNVDPTSVQNFLNKTVVPAINKQMDPLLPTVATIQNVLDTPIPILGQFTGLNLKQILENPLVAQHYGYDPANIDKLDNWIKSFEEFFGWSAPSPVNLTPLTYSFALPNTFDPRNPGALFQTFVDNSIDPNQLSIDFNKLHSDVNNLIAYLIDQPLQALQVPLPQVDLPMFTDPLTPLKALAGENVSLVQFSWPNFTVATKLGDFDLATIPLLGPLGVRIDLGVDGIFAGLSVGYDTYGFTDAWKKDSTDTGSIKAQNLPNGANLEEGVYIQDARLYLQGHIGLMAVAGVPLVELSGGGSVVLDFGIGSNFSGTNPNNQGLKFKTEDDPDSQGNMPVIKPGDHPYHTTSFEENGEKLLQLGDIVFDNDYGVSPAGGGPLCPFDIEGVISVDFSASLKVGVDPFSVKYTVDFGSITIGSFNYGTCSPDGGKLADTDPGVVTNAIALYDFFHQNALPNLQQVESQFELEDSKFNQNNQADQNVVLLDLGIFRYLWSDYKKKKQDPTQADFEIMPDQDGTGLLIHGFDEQQDVRLNLGPNLGGLNNANTTILAFGDPNFGDQYATDPISITVDAGVHANAYFVGGAGVNNFVYQGDGDTYLKGGDCTNLTLPPVDPNNPQALLPQNTLAGGAGTNYLVGGGVGPLSPPQAFDATWNVLQGGTGHNVLQAGDAGATLYAGPMNNDLLSGGNPPLGPTQYAFHAGTGSSRLVGGGINSINEFDWQEGDGSVDITGGANSSFQIQSPGQAGNTLVIGASTPDETWDIGTAQNQNPPSPHDIFIAAPNSSATIRARGLQVLSLDDSPGAANGTSITYQVEDLSKTGIGLVQTNLHEQDNPDGYQDRVVVNAPNADNTLGIDVSAPGQGHGPTTFVHIADEANAFAGPVSYYVQTAIPKPVDTLTVNSNDGNDTVQIDATQSNVDGTSTGGHVYVNTAGGDDTITSGNGNSGLDDFFGPLDIDAGAGHNKITFDDSASSVHDTVTLTATQVIRATKAHPPSQIVGLHETGYPFIINYQAQGGDFTPNDGSAGVVFKTTKGSTNLYVPETGAAAPTEIDCIGGLANTHDNIYVGYDGQAQTPFPTTIAQSTLDHLASPLTVHGSTGSPNPPVSVLQVDDQAAPAGEVYSLGIASQTLGIVRRTGAAVIEYDTAALDLETGNNGSQVTIAGVPKNASATISAGSGQNQIFVGGRRLPPPFPPLYVLDNIYGPVTIDGGAGQSDLTIDDGGNGSAQSYVLDAKQLYRSATANPPGPAVTIQFSKLHSLTFDASDNSGGTDSIAVSGTPAGVPVVVNTGDGSATLNLNGLDSTKGQLDYYWAAGTKQVTIDDSATAAGHTYQLDNGAAITTLKRSGAAPVAWHGFLSSWQLFLGAHADNVKVEEEAAGTSGLILTGAGQDSILVAPTGKDLDAIQGPLGVIGNGVTDLTLDDQNGAASRNYQLTASSVLVVQTPALPPIQFSGLGRLTLNGSTAGSAVYQVLSLPAIPIAINAHGAANGMQGPNQNNQWTITGADAGALDGNLQFQDIQSLLGGSDSDTFAFQAAGSLSGTLNGGAGTNTLDYTSYVGNVVADLSLQLASLVHALAPASVSNIQNVKGSQGNCLLVGDAQPNVLTGGTVRNVIIGRAGADIIDATPSKDDNLLISDSTAWDLNLPALQALFAEWSRTDLGFADRYSDLTTGSNQHGAKALNYVSGKPILLTPATVFPDLSLDILTGGAPKNNNGATTHDWFFVDPGDIITNFKNVGDAKTVI
jgi:hypothetical protein